MKLIHIAFAAFAASLLPSASADEPVAGKPFTVSFASSVTPVSHPNFRYPAYAATRDLAGSCDVSFDISAAGKADAVDVGACSAHIFHDAAARAVKSMTFAPIAQTGVTMKIRWTVQPETPALKTASLD